MRSFLGLVIFFFGLQSGVANATGSPLEPPVLPNHLHCLDNSKQSMAYNNSTVVYWQKTTKDQYKDRALINGTVLTVYPSKTGHTHFAMGLAGGGAIEVIYNDEFGRLPALRSGMPVIACGDYITVGKGARLPSPQPAIIHWVHYNPGDRDGGIHPSGFLIINGTPYGISGQSIQ